jgi:hypothetical protein
MGQVVGTSGRKADAPVSTPIAPAHVLGTIFHTLFDVGKLRLDASVPAEILRLATQTDPIHELF